MKKPIYLFLFLSCVISLFTGCNNDVPETLTKKEYPRVPIELTNETRAVAEELSNFFILYTKDVAEYYDTPESGLKTSNFICSPLGTSMMMGMTANGLEETGKKDYCDYLGVSNLSALNSLSLTLLKNLPKSDVNSDFNIGNSIWINTFFNPTMDEAFMDEMRINYLADFKYLDFSSSTAISELINWSLDKTGESLNSPYLPSFSTTRALILNTHSLKAPWKGITFKPQNTKDGIFHGRSGDTTIPFMSSEEHSVMISDSEKFTLCTLPLGNGAFSLQILLPNPDLSLNEATQGLTPEAVEDLKLSQEREKVVIKLPKFKIGNDLSTIDVLLNNTRKDLKKEYMFTMFKEDDLLFVSLWQFLSFAIDESGAELKVVSSSGQYEFIDDAPDYREITIDRPFFFFINEYSTGACLLSGRITDL